jgi:hypothetical protein
MGRTVGFAEGSTHPTTSVPRKSPIFRGTLGATRTAATGLRISLARQSAPTVFPKSSSGYVYSSTAFSSSVSSSVRPCPMARKSRRVVHCHRAVTGALPRTPPPRSGWRSSKPASPTANNPRQPSRFFPLNREFLRFSSLHRRSAVKTASKFRPLQRIPLEELNGNLDRANRELNRPNRELRENWFAKHKKKMMKRYIVPPRQNEIKYDPNDGGDATARVRLF